MNSAFILPILGIIVCLGLGVLANQRAARPRNDAARIRVPWLAIMFACGFFGFWLVMYLLHLLGSG